MVSGRGMQLCTGTKKVTLHLNVVGLLLEEKVSSQVTGFKAHI
jgi:hypothetical protein